MMKNPSRVPLATSKDQNYDFKDIDVLCTFKMKIESHIYKLWCTSSVLQSPKSGLKEHWCSLHLQNQDREQKFRSWVYQRPVTISHSKSRSRTSSILQSQKSRLKGQDVLCIFNIKIESQNSEHRCTKDQLPHANQDPDAKSQLGTSSTL